VGALGGSTSSQAPPGPLEELRSRIKLARPSLRNEGTVMKYTLYSVLVFVVFAGIPAFLQEKQSHASLASFFSWFSDFF